MRAVRAERAARLLQPLALSIVDVWTAPHTLVHTLGSQLRGLKDEWLEKSRSDGMNVKREYEFLADLA
jgi:hypothetical protein